MAEQQTIGPRYSCRVYFEDSGCKESNATLVSKDDFNVLCDKEQFEDGPFRESFGDNYGEPYNPRRQAFGRLKDGRYVYCELSSSEKLS